METARALLYLLLFSLSVAVPHTSPQEAGGQMQSGGVGNEPIQIAALGRAFSLGMFYDSRSDKLIPGLTLWDKDKLESGMTVTPQPNTEFNIEASESISEKLFSLGVEASLKASFLSGLVSVEGSAKYLKDDKKSSKQARVTLQYKATTVFKAMSMNQLGTGHLDYSDVIDKDLATHVVTGIQYGAQAFFVFNQESSVDESVQDIQGTLKVMIKKIPTIQIEGNGSLSMEDTDRENVKKFSCTFHGDFRLPISPTTFEEAVKVYQSLPILLGPNGENAVPIVVHLLPLSALDSRASKLVRQISLRLVTEAENILEGFTELEMWSNDVLRSPAGQKISQISKNINTFKALCSEFKLGLQETLAQKLPLIRGGGEGEAGLAEVLRKVAETPFNRNKLKQWTEDKTDQAETMITIIKLMKNTEMVFSENTLANKVINSAHSLVFVFTFLRGANPFLSEIEEYLKEPQSGRSDSTRHRHWYSSKNVIDSVRHKAKLFSDFAETNKDIAKDYIQFQALILTDDNHEGSTIHLYEDGNRISENFEVPSKPKLLTVNEMSHRSVSLTFSAPTHGAQSITGYRVEYCEKGQEEWNYQSQTEAGTVTVNNLKPNTEYSVRVRAITDVGVGPEAAPKTLLKHKKFIKTLPCSPPEDLRGNASISEISVYWRRPAYVGEGINIQSYIVEFGQTKENIKWMREESQSEEKVIFGLQPETSYTIRVLCDCKENGTSRYSSIITVTTRNCTTDPQQDKQSLLRNLTDKLDLLQIKVDSLKTLSQDQVVKLKTYENRFRLLQSENQNQARMLNRFDAHLLQLQTKTRGQEYELSELRSLTSRTSVTENQVESLRRDREAGRVAFSAALGGSGYKGPYSNPKILVFGDVFSNIGNAYNANTGIFTAPVKGLYHFEYFIHIGAGSPGTEVKLEKNEQHIVATDEQQREGSGSAGNAASLLLEVGDTVRLRLWSNWRIYDNYLHYCTFSGRLLFLM